MNSEKEQSVSPFDGPVSVFVGPTGRFIDPTVVQRANVVLLPPAGPGDIEDRLRDSSSDLEVLAIVDGWFHQQGALSHEEIRKALKRGWQVWGLSSFGAIRAYDMRHAGMLGFGRVYADLCAGKIISDTEVLSIYSHEVPYTWTSAPLLDLRVCLEKLVKQNMITSAVANDIIDTLSSTWFGDRTIDFLAALVTDKASLPSAQVTRLLANFDDSRLGVTDLQKFLSDKPWINQSAVG